MAWKALQGPEGLEGRGDEGKQEATGAGADIPACTAAGPRKL